MSRPPRRRLDPAERREEILDAANALFAQRGYEEVSIEDIAASAGVTRGLVHHYFGGRKDVYLALLQRVGARREEQLRPPVGRTARARVEDSISRWMEWTHANRMIYLGTIAPGEDLADPDVPVLFLTARDAVEDRIAGLTAGGDDYVTKPFSLEEVVARLRGLIRRGGTAALAEAGNVLVVGDLTLDEDSHEVHRAGEEISLTATEFELLRFLMRNPRRVLSKAQILDRVWSYDFGGKSSVVEIYISYLRKKIDAGEEAMIHTVRGVAIRSVKQFFEKQKDH